MKSLINLILCGIVSAGCSKAASDKPGAERRPDAGRTAASPAPPPEPTGKAALITAPAVLRTTVKAADGTTCEATIDDDCRQCVKSKAGDGSILAACDTLKGNATAGPATGTPLARLCKEALECIRRTTCHASNLINCYCGSTIDHGTCFATKTESNGACKKELERALQVPSGSVGLEALRLITEPNTAGGTAGIIATFENTPCAAVCLPYQATACN